MSVRCAFPIERRNVSGIKVFISAFPWKAAASLLSACIKEDPLSTRDACVVLQLCPGYLAHLSCTWQGTP